MTTTLTHRHTWRQRCTRPQQPGGRCVAFLLLVAMCPPSDHARTSQEVDAAADAKRPKLSASVSAGGTASLDITPPAGPSAGAAVAPGGTAIKYGRLTHSSGGARAPPPPRDVVVHADDDDDFV